MQIQKHTDLLNILTRSERQVLKRRLKIAKYLLEGKDYEEIRSLLNVGFSTIARVNNWLHVSGKSVKKLLEDKALLSQVLLVGSGIISSYLLSGSDFEGTVALGIASPFIAKHYIERGGEKMRNKIIGVGIGAALLLSVAVPAFAADTTTSTLGSAVKTCNQTYQSTVKDISSKVKAGSLNKTDAQTQRKSALTAKNTCVKDAQKAAGVALKAKRAEEKAKMEAKRAEAKTKMEAKKAEMKAKIAAKKAAKSTSTSK